MLTDTPWESQRHEGVGAVWQLWASGCRPLQGLLATWPCPAGAPGRPPQASWHLCPLWSSSLLLRWQVTEADLSRVNPGTLLRMGRTLSPRGHSVQT